MTLQEFPPKRKTAPEQLIDHQELLPMRFARVRAGFRRRSVWSIYFKSILAVHILTIPSPGTPGGYRRRRDPYKHV